MLRVRRRPAKRMSLVCMSVFLLQLINGAYSAPKSYNEVVDTLFQRLEPKHCVLWLNTSGESGCSTSFQSTSAPIELHESIHSLQHHAVVLLPQTNATGFLEDVLSSNKASYVAGVLVATDTHRPANFSPATDQPVADWVPTENNVSAVEPVWNPSGSGFLHYRFSFPLALLDREMSMLARRAARFSSQLGSVGSFFGKARIGAQMSATGTSHSCLEQRTCLPLGGYSVLAAPASNNSAPPARLLILSRIDTSALFLGAGVGARASIASFAASVATAELLSSACSQRLPVAFAALAGESLGLLGIRRLLHEAALKNVGAKPLQTELLDGVLELGSLGARSRKLFAHTDVRNASSDMLLDSLTGVSANGTDDVQPSTRVPSTTSLHALPEFGLSNVSAVTLSDSDTQLEHGYLWSYLDNAKNNLSIDAVAGAAQVAAEGANTFLEQRSAGDSASCSGMHSHERARMIVEQVFDCFLGTEEETSACDLASSLLGTGTFKRERANMVSTMRNIKVEKPHTHKGKSDQERLVFHLLGNATAGLSKTACASDARSSASTVSTNGAIKCFNEKQVHVAYMPALSARLQPEGKGHWSVREANNSFEAAEPLWTESFWAPNALEASIFAGASKHFDVAVFLAGLFATALAVIFVIVDTYRR